MLRTSAACHEDRFARFEYARRVPHAARYHYCCATAQRHATLAVGLFEYEVDRAADLNDEFVAGRMPLPTGPVLGESIGADQAATVQIAARFEHLPEVRRDGERQGRRTVGELDESLEGIECAHRVYSVEAGVNQIALRNGRMLEQMFRGVSAIRRVGRGPGLAPVGRDIERASGRRTRGIRD
jgi:hypothetical protein